MWCRGRLAPRSRAILAGLVGLCPGTGLAHDGPRVNYLCDGYRAITVAYAEEAADLWIDSTRIALARPPGELGYFSADGSQRISGKGADLVWIDGSGRNWWCVEIPDEGAAAAGVAGLAGTRWQLLHFRAPAVSGGVLVPPNPGAYQLTFGARGLLAMQLDCNSLRSSWIAVPLAPHRGTVEFSEGLMTRAACAQGALDPDRPRPAPGAGLFDP